MSDIDVHTYHNTFQLLPQDRLGWVGLSVDSAPVCLPRAELATRMPVLDLAVRSCSFALQNCPQGDITCAVTSYYLANALFRRFEASGIIADLHEAIACHREALSLTNATFRQFQESGITTDPHDAIARHGEASSLLRHYGDPSTSLNDLAFCLYMRFKRLGLLSDLREAINLNRKALELRQPGHSDRPATLNNLALCLASLFDQQGIPSDLDAAIQLLRDTVDLLQQDGPHRCVVLLNLGDCLYTRSKYAEDRGDLDSAIELHREALAQQADPIRSNSLARSLLSRFNALKQPADLEEAIDLDRDTVSHCPTGDSILPKSLHNLGECFFARFNLFEQLTDLDEAIKYHRNALDLRPQDHPDRSSSLSSLAKCLLTLSKRSEQFSSTAYDEAFTLYSELANASQAVRAVFIQDVYAAWEWVAAAEETDDDSKISAYQTLFKLLLYHLATLPALTQHYPLLKKLPISLAMDAFSACLRRRRPAMTTAVELLEQGRAVFLGLLSRLRSPLDEVEAFGDRGKQLADRFKELASPIRHASQQDAVWDLNAQLQDVVSDIRRLPGLSRFLLPPRFSDLKQAASEGPVIIVNTSQYGCDVLVISYSRDPIRIPLQITREGIRDLSSQLRALTVSAKTKTLKMLLRKLWDQIVSPIVDVLRQTLRLPLQSRIWWCPTGDSYVLPLHAAGPFRLGRQDLPNLYISSYTPTLAILIHARRHDPPSSTVEQKRFIAIGASNAPGCGVLPGVVVELNEIDRHVSGIATFTRLEGEEACISRTVEELEKNEWVHFACHGSPDKQPFQSSFPLYDGDLTIQHIVRCQSKVGELAYLSACLTMIGDEESLDEVIHLASSLQFIGFRSVIGTMWVVHDSEGPKVASMFYEHVVDESGHLDHTRAAFALNKTMRSADTSLHQRVQYIHLGA